MGELTARRSRCRRKETDRKKEERTTRLKVTEHRDKARSKINTKDPFAFPSKFRVVERKGGGFILRPYLLKCVDSVSKRLSSDERGSLVIHLVRVVQQKRSIPSRVSSCSWKAEELL